MPTRKEQLEKIIAEARDELWKIQEAEAQESNSRLIGKCFKYHNCYTDAERWWLYLTVTGVEGSQLKTFTFQKDINGKIEIDTNWYRSQLVGGYQEIDKDEFFEAWRRLQAEITQINF